MSHHYYHPRMWIGNKKVLSCERKKHTFRRVASTRYAVGVPPVQVLAQDGGEGGVMTILPMGVEGVTIPGLDGASPIKVSGQYWGGPLSDQEGGSPILTWEGAPPILARERGTHAS